MKRANAQRLALAVFSAVSSRSRDHRQRTGRITGLAVSLLLVGAPAARANVDLTGVFIVDLAGFVCTFDFTQSGTALSSSGSCASLGVTFTTAGTIDPATGVFALTGTGATGPNPCSAGFAINATASADGDIFLGAFVCTPLGSGRASGRRIGIRPTVGCGSLDQCHPGTCDPATGLCSYSPAPDGTPCDDGSACTQADACLGGVCTGTPVEECAHRACNATCRRDVARCMATQCTDVSPKACRRRCKPAPIRTLAYAMSECRVDAAGFRRRASGVAHPSGRPGADHRRGVRSVRARPGPAGTLPGVWRRLGGGSSSVIVFPLQRLGVSPDGSGVVFEVNDEFSFPAPSRSRRRRKGSSSSGPTAMDCVASARRAATRASASGRISSAARRTSGETGFSLLRYSSARTAVGSRSRISGRDPGARRPCKSSCSIS